MRQVCAWCGKELKVSHMRCNGTSYGICVPCANAVINKIPSLMRDFVERIDEPVVIVNDDCVIKIANRGVCSFLQKELAQVEGLRCGEVFGCVRAGTSEGCGRSLNCPGCQIRRCVTQTYRTGKGVSRVCALNRGETLQESSEVSWIVSTTKFLDGVVLKITAAVPLAKAPPGEEAGAGHGQEPLKRAAM